MLRCAANVWGNKKMGGVCHPWFQLSGHSPEREVGMDLVYNTWPGGGEVVGEGYMASQSPTYPKPVSGKPARCKKQAFTFMLRPAHCFCYLCEVQGDQASSLFYCGNLLQKLKKIWEAQKMPNNWLSPQMPAWAREPIPGAGNSIQFPQRAGMDWMTQVNTCYT